MKKLFLILALATSFSLRGFACADYDANDGYYNLFVQETIGDPQYFPFLLTLGSAYYDSNINDKFSNENIEEWSNYLNINYKDACYLVFKAKKSDVDDLIAGRNVANDSLSFATQSFVKQHIQALKYISYAKYLEPYMSYKLELNEQNSWQYDENNPPKSVANLDYDKIIDVLQRSWNAETDKELKLRYGYQLVRFAHYYGNFDKAIQFFNEYVESLDYKPVMYFYALDQKAGAERGLGNMAQAAADFFTVFNNTQNIKTDVYSSMRLCTGKIDEDGDTYYAFSDSFFEELLKQAKTDDARNNIYLFLGYQDFNNPLQSLKKIISTSPGAIQAKVLMARAVNQLERTFLTTTISRCPDNKEYYWGLRVDLTDCLPNLTDRRLPIVSKEIPEYQFLEDALAISLKQTQNNVEDKNFWNTTTAYLYFLKKDYDSAKKYLEKVDGNNQLFGEQKTRMEMLIEICEQPTIQQSKLAWLPNWMKKLFGISNKITIITPEFENILFTKYKNVFDAVNLPGMQDQYFSSSTTTQDFVIDILANRYYIQRDLAKSFLLQNSLKALESNPDLDLIAEIEAFYHKKNKSPMDKYLAGNIDVDAYLADIKGTVYLSQGNLEKALSCFKQGNDNSNISNLIFGHNRIESFESPENEVMRIDYTDDFPFIQNRMNKKELTETLIQLQKAAKKDDELAAKANYLLGNFFYNTTSTGYFRHILRFDQTNGNGEKYYGDNNKPVNLSGNVYLKNYAYSYYFPDNLTLPNQYLERAMALAKDDELRAHIAFALSKTEQEEFYIQNDMSGYGGETPENDGILITNRKYFKELSKYSDTKFYDEVRTNCLYFDYYITYF
ncbi:MAG: hypothetical protein FWD60_05860 [Candidatus Azobacteroides sp.]|nr:hypothetical protein [Candidatus Azobacteroides sp.]